MVRTYNTNNKSGIATGKRGAKSGHRPQSAIEHATLQCRKGTQSSSSFVGRVIPAGILMPRLAEEQSGRRSVGPCAIRVSPIL